MSQKYEIKSHDCGRKYAYFATDEYEADVPIFDGDTDDVISERVAEWKSFIEKEIERQG